MAYRDGTPSGGRPKGRLNDKTLAVQSFCRSVCEDEAYRESILQRARTNTLGSMEPVIWAYGYGRPKDSLDVRFGRLGEEDLSELSMEELTARAEAVLAQAREAADIARQLGPAPPDIDVVEVDKCSEP